MLHKVGAITRKLLFALVIIAAVAVGALWIMSFRTGGTIWVRFERSNVYRELRISTSHGHVNVEKLRRTGGISSTYNLGMPRECDFAFRASGHEWMLRSLAPDG